MMVRVSVFLLCICSLIACAQERPLTSQDRIRLNQVGFYPDGPKKAAVLTNAVVDFSVQDADTKDVVFSGKTLPPVKSIHSGKEYSTADFSALTKSGRYILSVAGIGTSYPFNVKAEVHRELATASIKNYYFQRMSMPLDEKHAGKWKRNAGHPDRQVWIHPSAASATRPAGSRISSPRGWYDAGDYNKYIVNSGITMGTMLSAFEDFQPFYEKLPLNIPETPNTVPDLLDELLWNLRWMLTMQDPEDGGVYHKLTNPRFDAMVMPDKAVEPRYVVQKSTTAALDFAAVTAQAARIFQAYQNEFPGLADSCLNASRKAFEWAVKHPAALYDQNTMNQQYDPDVVTGAYGDRSARDEFSWAASELFVTTKELRFLEEIRRYADSSLSVPSWPDVRMCGYYSIVRHRDSLLQEGQELATALAGSVIRLADRLVKGTENNPYQCVMGKTARDFVWGSSAVAANQAVVLINAFLISGKALYLDHALHNLDYLLGRNGTGYSFVTGVGSKTPMHPHHRPSEADGVADPIPGMLSGGPNPSMQDKCRYASSHADEAFTDDVCSYASNEIAINWNAPLVYLSGALEALQYKRGYAKQ